MLPESRLVKNFHISLDFLVQIYLQGNYKPTQKLSDRFFIITLEGCSLRIQPFQKEVRRPLTEYCTKPNLFVKGLDVAGF